MRSEQKTEIEKLNAKKLILNSDLAAHQAEDKMKELIMDSAMENADLAIVQTEPEATQKSESSDPHADALRKHKESSEAKEKNLRDKYEKKQKDQEDRKRKKQEEVEAKKQDKLDYENSAIGKADAFIKGLNNDLTKLKTTITETGTCGLKAGFAREWKETFEACKTALEDHKKSLTKVAQGKHGKANPEELLKAAKASAEDLKKELRNFQTVKRQSLK